MSSFSWRGLVVVALMLWAQQASVHAQAKNEEHVAGTVVSAADGHALAHAQVILTNTRTEEVTATTAADEAGHFRFEPVPPGKYRLSGTAAHFMPTSYLQHEEYSTALVTGAGLATDSLVLGLVPSGSISGRVVDESGEPVGNASVVLYREDLTAAQTVGHDRQTQPDDTGEYEFTGLKPGRYFLSVTGMPWYATHTQAPEDTAKVPYREAIDPELDVAYGMVFYADASDSDHATALELGPGEHLTADMHLLAERALTVTLHQPKGTGGARNFMLARRVFGAEEPLNTSQSMADGTVTMAGIAPGHYELEQLVGGGILSAQSMPLDLTAGGVNMDMPKQGETSTVTATVHMAGGRPVPAQLQLALHSVQTNRNFVSVASDKGVAGFADVPAGEYGFSAGSSDKFIAVLGVTMEGKRLGESRLTVAHNLSVDLELSTTQVDVEGFVKRAGTTGEAAMVVLVPVGPDKSAERFRRDQSDLDGSFVLRNVVAGNYILVAIDDGWPLRWTDMEVMTPYLIHGVPVSITESNTSPVHVKEATIAQPRQ